MDESEPRTILLALLPEDYPRRSVNLGRGPIFKISKKGYDQFLSQIVATSSPTSTLSKAKAEKSELLSGTCSMMESTSTHVRLATCTLALQSWSGQTSLGQVTLKQTVDLRNNVIIDITIDDLCVRRLVTALTMEESPQPLPRKLRLRLD